MSVGLCYLSVCAENDIPLSEITNFVNASYPTGIKTKWTFAKDAPFEDGTPNPVMCNMYPEARTHYLFYC